MNVLLDIGFACGGFAEVTATEVEIADGVVLKLAGARLTVNGTEIAVSELAVGMLAVDEQVVDAEVFSRRLNERRDGLTTMTLYRQILWRDQSW